MKKNKLVLIVPFYNTEKYILECVGSILAQKYENWEAIFIDDASTDNCFELIPNHPKIIKIKNTVRVGALENTHKGILLKELDDEDIIVIIDGDDRLLNDDSLNIVNWVYNEKQCLVSYGDFVTNYNLPGVCTPYESEEEFLDLRHRTYRATHLRTFKYKVYKEILKQDPELDCYRSSVDNNFYTITSDVAMMNAVMEIAGFKNVFYNKIPIYWYRLYDANDFNKRRADQLAVELEIRNKPRFNQIF